MPLKIGVHGPTNMVACEAARVANSVAAQSNLFISGSFVIDTTDSTVCTAGKSDLTPSGQGLDEVAGRARCPRVPTAPLIQHTTYRRGAVGTAPYLRLCQWPGLWARSKRCSGVLVGTCGRRDPIAPLTPALSPLRGEGDRGACAVKMRHLVFSLSPQRGEGRGEGCDCSLNDDIAKAQEANCQPQKNTGKNVVLGMLM